MSVDGPIASTAAQTSRDAHSSLRDLVSDSIEDLRSLAEAAPVGRLNRPLLALLGEDLLPHLFPRSVGGVHDDAVSSTELCVLREELGRLMPAAETTLALQGLGAYPILFHGSDPVVQEWLPQVVDGTAAAAFALTESGAGSDATAISMTAHRDGDGWRLNGTKTFISNAPDADIYTLFAKTDPDAGSRGVTAFALPGNSDGLSGIAYDMIAPHVIGEITLEDVFLPNSHVLGELNRGFRVAMSTLDLFRPSVGAYAVGMAQHALDLTIRYTTEREAFGGRLRDLQAVQHKVADMALSIEAARLLVFRAAEVYDTGAPGLTHKSAMAKLFATECAQRVVDDAVQLHGALALRKGHPLELLYREVRAPRIYEGTSEVQRTIIARGTYEGT